MSCTYANTAMISDDWQPRLQDISDYISPATSGLRVSILRLDEIDPVISGNKWFKLKENISTALKEGKDTLITFGGAYSNHLIATAAAAHQYGLNTIGIVRGEPEYASNPTLSNCLAYGMQLIFVTREQYCAKNDPVFVNSILPDANNRLLIPEGGANESGRVGVGHIAKWIPDSATHIAVSVGTGTTLAGISNSWPDKSILGFCATKACHEQHLDINSWTKNSVTNYQLYPDNYFGGFGKWNEDLITFIRNFYQHTSIPLDVIYTGKMMYQLQKLIQSGNIPQDSHIVCIHTGGLQGNPTDLFAS